MSVTTRTLPWFRRSKVLPTVSDRPAYLFGVAAACIVLMLGLLGFVFASRVAPTYDPSDWARIFDTSSGVNVLLMGHATAWPQGVAHRCMLGALALLFGLLTFLGSRRTDALVTRLAWPWAPMIIVIWLVIMIVLSALGLPNGFEHTRVESRHGLEFGLGILVTGALFSFGPSLRRWNGACLALTLVLLGALLAPAFWSHVDLSQLPWSEIEGGWQQHYEFVLAGPTDRLAAGQRLGENLVPWYGVVVPVVLAGIQRHLEPWTFGDYVRFAQGMQIVFFVLLLPSYAFYTRRRWPLCLLALAFVGMNYHSNTYLLLFLNLMGWRFLGFPAAFAGFLVAHRLRPDRGALLLGGISGSCLLYNPETGAAVTAGLAASVMLRRMGDSSQRWRRQLGDGALFLGGGGVAVIGFLLLHRVCLGEWMGWNAPSAVADLLFLFSRGFGGAVPSFDRLAIVVFGHATAALVWSWIERRRPLSLRRGMRAVAATIIVVWFAYYANHPNAAYLSSLLVPYSFLLFDTLRVAMLGSRGLSIGRWKLALSLGTLSLALIPHAVLTVRVQLPLYARGIEHAWRGRASQGRLVQGVWLPDDSRTRRILTQGAFLRAHPPGEPLIYFTFDNCLVAKEAGVWPDLPLPLANPFSGTLTAEHYQSLLRTVRSPEVRRIYFDSWRDLSLAEADCTPEIWQFYERLRFDLSGTFVPRRTIAGWEEWVRR